MFRRKKPEEGYRYKNETLGTLGINFTQLPHAHTDTSGNRAEAVTFTYSLRIDNYGPILMTRTYLMITSQDTPESRFNWLRYDSLAKTEFDARLNFYRELASVLND